MLVQDLIQNEEDLAKCFSRVQFLVLDEADRLLEPTFEAELRLIAGVLPSKRQTLLFSATMTKSLVTMQTAVLKNAYYFQVHSTISKSNETVKGQASVCILCGSGQEHQAICIKAVCWVQLRANVSCVLFPLGSKV